jgi:hypothetical protein
MEYCSTIWNTHTTSNINKLESIQKNAARFVLNKPHDYKKPDSTTKMVKDLNGKNEYLYIFMFVLIVCNFQAWLWRDDVISAIVG